MRHVHLKGSAWSNRCYLGLLGYQPCQESFMPLLDCHWAIGRTCMSFGLPGTLDGVTSLCASGYCHHWSISPKQWGSWQIWWLQQLLTMVGHLRRSPKILANLVHQEGESGSQTNMVCLDVRILHDAGQMDIVIQRDQNIGLPSAHLSRRMQRTICCYWGLGGRVWVKVCQPFRALKRWWYLEYCHGGYQGMDNSEIWEAITMYSTE